MKHCATLFLFGSLWLEQCPLAQAQQAPSPYHTQANIDVPLVLGLMGASAAGLYLVQHKSRSTPAELVILDRQSVNPIDRFSAGWYSHRAQLISDVLCYGTLAGVPALLAFDPAAHSRYGQVAGLSVETMAVTAAIFTLSVGTVHRYRPYLYGPEGGRLRGGVVATNSFFGGHTAHTATACFFAAQVFHDFNPDSPAQPYLWSVAAVVPAVVAFYRIRAGKHFLTDNLVGYAVGGTVGVLVPRLHRQGTANGGVIVLPQDYTGALLGCAVGATIGAVTLHCYRRHSTGLSLAPVQGVNCNGYAYGGVSLTKRW